MSSKVEDGACELSTGRFNVFFSFTWIDGIFLMRRTPVALFEVCFSRFSVNSNNLREVTGVLLTDHAKLTNALSLKPIGD